MLVRLLKYRRVDGTCNRLLDLIGRGPDVAQIDRPAVLSPPKRFCAQVDIHGAGERVGDDERRRCEVGGAYLWVDAALEVAIAAEDGGDDKAVLVDCLGNRLQERAAVADAGRAAEADEIEVQGFEIAHKTRALQIVDDGAGARRQARLHVRCDAEAARDGIAREKPRAEHDRGVGGVGTARDGRDDDRAVRQLRAVSV